MSSNQWDYVDAEIEILIDMYFRDNPRPAPYPAIAEAMGRPTRESGLDDLLWKVVTGYGGNTATGPRRKIIRRTPRRVAYRATRKWWPREDNALRAALAGEGQRRNPPCDIKYIATVLARTVTEVENRWTCINGDALGRRGFFSCEVLDTGSAITAEVKELVDE